jgi:hypothetical protein
MAAAITLVSVRQAVANFLEGYAHAARDDAKLLKQSVAGPRLQEWARWIMVQNDNRSGTVSGRSVIRNIELLGPQGTSGDQYLMQVDATDRFVVTGPGAEPVTVARQFLGQALVARTPEGGWGVADIIRDGQQLGLEIHILPRTIVTSTSGLTVRAESVFTFGNTWVVNLLVDNQSSSALQVVPRLTWVRSGSVLARAKTLDEKLLNPVPAGDRVLTQITAEPGDTVPVQALLQIAFVTPQRTVLQGRLVLPFGPQGATGPTGPTGVSGPTGGGTAAAAGS